MDQRQTNTKIAGIDVGKLRLDGAGHGLEDMTQVANAPEGFGALIAWLKTRDVGRVGLKPPVAEPVLGTACGRTRGSGAYVWPWKRRGSRWWCIRVLSV